MNDFLGNLTALFWENLHYTLELGKLTFITWRLRKVGPLPRSRTVLNVRVKTVRHAGTTIGASRPKSGTSNSPNQAS